jgi:hypothetical protein
MFILGCWVGSILLLTKILSFLLVYQKDHNGWKLNKSFYRKLRLSQESVDRQLRDAGFMQIEYEVNNGLIVVIATK